MSLKSNWATGDSFGATDLNALASAVNALGFNAQTATVAAAETTSSTTYADLATTTDSVTVTIGSSGMALVYFSSGDAWNSTGGSTNYVSVALSGANTVSASDANGAVFQPYTANGHASPNKLLLLTGLAAGSTTFKMKYRAASGTASFSNRNIAVIPFP